MAKAEGNSRRGKGSRAAKTGATVPAIELVRLEQLHFDPDNPRFGNQKPGQTDSQILDEIVRVFGIEDVLNSIAVNGYMHTEPLVGVALANGNGIRLKEGNRRLAALLILAGDPRAAAHAQLRANHPLAPDAVINPVPVVVYKQGTEPRQMLPYLGVRHIVGSRPWDSFAKAAWVANVLERHGETITLEQIEDMTGDTRGTIARLLEGYYLVIQLIDVDRFSPNDCLKKGRGSSVDFPFSWVYNALGYGNVREWVGMKGEEIGSDPVPEDHLDQAGELMVFMFGRKSTKTEPVMKESREIGELAICLGDEKKVAQLRNGKMVKEVLWTSKSGLDRVLQNLAKADESISDALGTVAELTLEQVDLVEPEASKVRKKAKSLHDSLLDRKKSGDD